MAEATFRQQIPVDSKHMIEVWIALGGTPWYIPHFSRSGKSWSPYTIHGERYSTTSLKAAYHLIHRNLGWLRG